MRLDGHLCAEHAVADTLDIRSACLTYLGLAAQVVVSQNNAGQGGMNDPLVQLQATSEDQDYMEFKMNGDVRGGIKTAENGGIVMSSESGDFAEWHPQVDKTVRAPHPRI